MSKVVKQNVILGGQEIKAGTSESDIPDEVKKQASKFLIDEKKYKSVGKPAEAIDAKIQAQITDLEKEVNSATARADTAESSLSEANSRIAGLETEVANATDRADESEAKVVKLEDAAKAVKKAGK